MKQETQETTKVTTVSPKGEIAIVTSCEDDWGGSEELWARSLPYFQAEGYSISVYKWAMNKNHPEYQKFSSNGIRLVDLTPPPPEKKSLAFRTWRRMSRLADAEAYPTPPGRAEEVLKLKLTEIRPTLLILAQGINFDGALYGQVCLDLQLNYVTISQKAAEFIWPEPWNREIISRVFQEAKLNVFVSRHNLRITEEQIGKKLENAIVLFNPIKIARKNIPYPSTNNGYKLACIGRYFFMDKGQDILLRVLAREEWQNRPLSVSFFGFGKDKVALKELAVFLQLKNVEFMEFKADIEKIWEEHHALILPSRGEGMPLVLLEAMSAGRTAIVTDAGGNTEVVEDGVTGFVGLPLEIPFHETMERAWNNRHQWEGMGIKASEFIKQNVPVSPEQVFAVQLKKLFHG